jgi:hypothetical protein
VHPGALRPLGHAALRDDKRIGGAGEILRLTAAAIFFPPVGSTGLDAVCYL